VPKSTCDETRRQTVGPIALRPEEPDPRVAAFQIFLLSLDSRDARGVVSAARRLRTMGLSVVAIPPRGQGGRRHG
jgi:hypothetical protein